MVTERKGVWHLRNGRRITMEERGMDRNQNLREKKGRQLF